MKMNEGTKICSPGTMKAAGNSSSPIAAKKMGAAKRERRHVRMAVTTYVQPHVRANSAARGEVLEVLGQAAQNAASPARPATRNTPASSGLDRRMFRVPLGRLLVRVTHAAQHRFA